MLTIEEIKEIVKKEFGVNLEDRENDCYMSKNNVVCVFKRVWDNNWHIYLMKSSVHGISFELNNHHITTAKELKSLIRKFKKLREMI